MARGHDSFYVLAWNVIYFSHIGFSQDLRTEKGIQFHASHINKCLLRGYYALGDVAKEDQDALKALPGMTSDMLRTVNKYIELSKR